MSNTIKHTLIRPVKCHFCNEPMFYAGDPKHEPEIKVTIYSNANGDYNADNHFYCHIRCWNERMMGQPAAEGPQPISQAAKDYQSTV